MTPLSSPWPCWVAERPAPPPTYWLWAAGPLRLDSSMGRAGACWPAPRRRFESVSNLNGPCTGRQVRVIGFNSRPSGGGSRTARLSSAVVSAGTMSGARSGRDPRSAVRIRPQPHVPPPGGTWQAAIVTTSRGHGISSERPGRTAVTVHAGTPKVSEGLQAPVCGFESRPACGGGPGFESPGSAMAWCNGSIPHPGPVAQRQRRRAQTAFSAGSTPARPTALYRVDLPPSYGGKVMTRERRQRRRPRL
jgi:hypothetical protein